MFLTKQFLFSQRENRGQKVKRERKQVALTVRLQTNGIVTLRLLWSHQSLFLFGSECPSNELGEEMCFLCGFQAIKVHDGCKETCEQEFNADNILLLH